MACEDLMSICYTLLEGSECDDDAKELLFPESADAEDAHTGEEDADSGESTKVLVTKRQLGIFLVEVYRFAIECATAGASAWRFKDAKRLFGASPRAPTLVHTPEGAWAAVLDFQAGDEPSLMPASDEAARAYVEQIQALLRAMLPWEPEDLTGSDEAEEEDGESPSAPMLFRVSEAEAEGGPISLAVQFRNVATVAPVAKEIWSRLTYRKQVEDAVLSAPGSVPAAVAAAAEQARSTFMAIAPGTLPPVLSEALSSDEKLLKVYQRAWTSNKRDNRPVVAGLDPRQPEDDDEVGDDAACDPMPTVLELKRYCAELVRQSVNVAFGGRWTLENKTMSEAGGLWLTKPSPSLQHPTATVEDDNARAAAFMSLPNVHVVGSVQKLFLDESDGWMASELSTSGDVLVARFSQALLRLVGDDSETRVLVRGMTDLFPDVTYDTQLRVYAGVVNAHSADASKFLRALEKQLRATKLFSNKKHIFCVPGADGAFPAGGELCELRSADGDDMADGGDGDAMDEDGNEEVKAESGAAEDLRIEGSTFVFTGFRDAALEAAIKSAGGSVAKSMTKAVTVVIALDTDASSAKVAAAREKGLLVVSPSQVQAALGTSSAPSEGGSAKRGRAPPKSKSKVVAAAAGTKRAAEEDGEEEDDGHDASKDTAARAEADERRIAGSTFVFTGFRDAALEAAIKSAGGSVAKSMTKAVTVVIALDTDASSAKVAAAREKGLLVVSPSQVQAALGTSSAPSEGGSAKRGRAAPKSKSKGVAATAGTKRAAEEDDEQEDDNKGTAASAEADELRIEGSTFVFTGFRDAALEAAIKSAGGSVAKSMTKAVTMVVALDTDASSAKVAAAREKGLLVVSPAQVQAALGTSAAPEAKKPAAAKSRAAPSAAVKKPRRA